MYGCADANIVTGLAFIEEEDKQNVRDVFNKFVRDNEKDEDQDEVWLGFRVCIDGHDESSRILIPLDRRG